MYFCTEDCEAHHLAAQATAPVSGLAGWHLKHTCSASKRIPKCMLTLFVQDTGRLTIWQLKLQPLSQDWLGDLADLSAATPMQPHTPGQLTPGVLRCAVLVSSYGISGRAALRSAVLRCAVLCCERRFFHHWPHKNFCSAGVAAWPGQETPLTGMSRAPGQGCHGGPSFTGWQAALHK